MVRVEIDLLALQYRTTAIPGHCVGAPVGLDGAVAVPVREPNGAHSLLVVPGADVSRAERFPIEQAPQSPLYCQVPILDRKVALWLSAAGQLCLRPAAGVGAERVSWTPWPTRTTPEFDFGSPYLSKTGQLWQLCLDHDSDCFVYLRIGQRDPERHVVSNPRLCAGAVSYNFETQVRGDPWLDDGSEDAQVDEVVIPLLESVRSQTVLCLRAPFIGSATEFFATRDRHTATVEITGSRDTQFFVFRAVKPWLANAFVHDGYLHLYHPELTDGIPRWMMAC